MRKFFGPVGSVSRVIVESEVLKSNMLGDPPVRRRCLLSRWPRRTRIASAGESCRLYE